MTQYYYSVQPFLAWCLNHYFYNKQHFTYIGAPFYPYLLGNPRSSSPLRLYEDYYEPFKDDDEYSDFIGRKRYKLRKGVIKANKNLTPKLDPALVIDLRKICGKIDLTFYYPVVYRVDIEAIRANDPNRDKPDECRLQKKNSGAKVVIPGCGRASNEYTLTSLIEKNTSNKPDDGFDLLLDDLEVEIALQTAYLNSIMSKRSPVKPALRREQKKLDSYKTMKKLRDERDTLDGVNDVLPLLKQHFRRK